MVIKKVANKEQCETGVSLFWDLCEKKQPLLKRDDPSTWKTEHWVASPSVGIMSGIIHLIYIIFLSFASSSCFLCFLLFDYF